MGVLRQDDIPGAEIPAAYFEYLRRGGREKIDRIIYHNLMDTVTMVGLFARMLEFESYETGAAESYNIGRCCLDGKRPAKGIEYLKRALEDSLAASELHFAATKKLAAYLKREGEISKGPNIMGKPEK